MPSHHGTELRSVARTAYATLEPYHALAYFAPRLRPLAKDTGLSWRAQYVGMRAAPMGPCSPAVVSAAFFNFRAAELEQAWRDALGVGLDVLDRQREGLLDEVLPEVLAERTVDPELAELADRFRGIVEAVPGAGRPLGAAWAARPWPQAPHLVLWQASAVWREWRGDGHVAALVSSGLDPVEALVLSAAESADGGPRGVKMGAEQLRRSRAWSEQEWAAGAHGLRERGLIEATGEVGAGGEMEAAGEVGRHRLTADGTRLADELEEQTDDASAAIWADTADAADLLKRVRPYVKKVIDAGILPGTTRKS